LAFSQDVAAREDIPVPSPPWQSSVAISVMPKSMAPMGIRTDSGDPRLVHRMLAPPRSFQVVRIAAGKAGGYPSTAAADRMATYTGAAVEVGPSWASTVTSFASRSALQPG